MGADAEMETGQGLALEEAFEQLEEMVAQLESEDITLEESFRIYQQGMQVLKISEDGQTDEF